MLHTRRKQRVTGDGLRRELRAVDEEIGDGSCVAVDEEIGDENCVALDTEEVGLAGESGGSLKRMMLFSGDRVVFVPPRLCSVATCVCVADGSHMFSWFGKGHSGQLLSFIY